MGPRRKLNPIFQTDDEEKGLEPIVFNTPSAYNDKVKIHNWQMKTLAEPRDNKEIFPPNGNLHKSSYERLAPGDKGCTGVSETRAMLSQIESRAEYQRIYPHRALTKMRALASEKEEQEEEGLKLMDMLADPEQINLMDYRTTTKVDYRPPYPMKPKAPAAPPPPQPWLLYRRTIGYGLHTLENRDGVNTFLDDNMELHQRISELKMRRAEFYQTPVRANRKESVTQ